MVTNHESYRYDDPVREFKFKDKKTVLIPEGFECRIGFVLSDGAYLNMYGDSTGFGDTKDLCNVKWQQYGQRLRKDPYGARRPSWCPLIRVLC